MPEVQAFTQTSFAGFSDSLRTAISEAPLPGLGDGPVASDLTELLQDADFTKHLGNLSSDSVKACTSGLWLLAGDIDRSHDISQDLPSAEGSFLHGIMHRREGDFGNAKYWFRRVGSHPVLDQIANEVGGLYLDPFDFVDACSDAVRSGNDAKECQSAQWMEWQFLMTYMIDS